jgi:hypothetical protein
MSEKKSSTVTTRKLTVRGSTDAGSDKPAGTATTPVAGDKKQTISKRLGERKTATSDKKSDKTATPEAATKKSGPSVMVCCFRSV